MSDTTQKIGRAVGYSAWFFVCFVFAIGLTFPLDDFKPLVIDLIEKQALSKGKHGPHGVEPTVSIESLGMSGLGVKAKRVSIQMGSKEPEPGPTVELDTIVIKPPILSWLGNARSWSGSASLYGGDVAVDVTLDEKNNPVALDAEIDDVDLAKVPLLIAKLGVPVEGKIVADIELDLGKQAEKDAAGHVDLDIKGLGLGAGNLKAVPGGFEIGDGIKLGNLKGRMPVKQGLGTIESFKLEGAADVEAEVTGTVALKSKLEMSRVDLDGWFKPASAFLDKNGKIKSAMELGEKLGPLGKAKDDEGRYHFGARGAAKALQPALAKDAGKKAKAKANKASPAAAPPPPPPDEPPPPADD